MNIFGSWFENRRSGDLPRAQKIAGNGDCGEILNELKSADLLETYVATVKEKYLGIFNHADFVPSPEDWEMLTVLWLYDADIAEHSVRVFELAHELATHKFVVQEATVHLQKLIEKHHVTLDQFLRASLFHDSGKITLPREAISNSLNDHEMGELFIRMLEKGDRNAILSALKINPSSVKTNEEALDRLYEMGLRPKDAVPVREIFSGKDSAALEMIKQSGFSPDETLGEILSRHEQAGGKLFAHSDKIVAHIIEHHHPGVQLPGKKKKDADHLRDLEFMLALVDEFDAFGHQRSYKKAMAPLVVLFELAREAESGRLDRGLTYLWIANEYSHISALEKDGKRREIIKLETFLRDHENIKAAVNLASEE